MDYSLPGSSVHGILQARIQEWVAMPSSRGSSQPRNQTQVSHIAGRFFTIWVTREALEEDIISILWRRNLGPRAVRHLPEVTQLEMDRVGSDPNSDVQAHVHFPISHAIHQHLVLQPWTLSNGMTGWGVCGSAAGSPPIQVECVDHLNGSITIENSSPLCGGRQIHWTGVVKIRWWQLK